MELWIRSQYKEMLFKVNNNLVIRHNDTVGMCFIECDNHKIAMYKTKERALEVLDEIQSLLQLKIEYKPIVQEEPNTLYPYKNFIKVDDNMEIKELSTFVYQMPAE